MLKKLKQMCCQDDSVEEISPRQTCRDCYRTHQAPEACETDPESVRSGSAASVATSAQKVNVR